MVNRIKGNYVVKLLKYYKCDTKNQISSPYILAHPAILIFPGHNYENEDLSEQIIPTAAEDTTKSTKADFSM